MARSTISQSVEARAFPGVLVERWTYAPGPAGEIGRHAHEGYQLGIGFDMRGEYAYRGARWHVPTGRVTVLHPGEPHAVRDPEPRPGVVRYTMMYLDEAIVLDAAREMRGPRAALPFFPDPILPDARLAGAFLATASLSAEGIAREAATASFLELLVTAHRPADPPPPPPAAPEAVLRARDFLMDRLASPVTLAEVADAAGLSPFHLARAFRRRFGVPPYAYLLQARVERGKRLLAAGASPSRAALQAGFYDQSHFGRHFLRLTGVTPGRYRAARSS